MTYPHFKFEVTHQSTQSRARLGRLTTPHGTIETPGFIFCATKAALKGLSTTQLKQAGVDIILSNTYHLMLQPGCDVVAEMGGLHTFMNWGGPMLTDSGGFQVFSLGHGHVIDEIKGRARGHPRPKLKIGEEGVTFTSYRDGQKHLLTPESSMAIQQKLGADLIVSFDECTPYHVPRSYTEASMHMSARWGTRCLNYFTTHTTGQQALYSVIQGGTYEDLRALSADFSNDQPFFGQAIGGSLGASSTQMQDITTFTMDKLNRARPTHLLGIGKLKDIEQNILSGIDTFDCVHPTRLGRHGGALVDPHLCGTDHLNLKNARFQKDPHPIDEHCGCETCRHYSRAYLHHLFKAGEMLGPVALTLHNVYFMTRWMMRLRDEIRQNKR